jgi:NADH:ubiquinone oxidoreductase subunit 6 (subunit J)
MIIYLLFPLLTILGLSSVLSKNPINSVTSLIIVYIIASISFISLGSDFLAIISVTVYVGATSIPFPFVVTMLNLRLVIVRDTLRIHLPVGCFIGPLIILETYICLKTQVVQASMVTNTRNDDSLFDHLLV